MITTTSRNLPPLLKWAGGKYGQPTIYTRITELYTPFRNTHLWIEPFCGALGLTHRIQPANALLSDSNHHLIRFHKAIQRNVDFSYQTWMVGTPYNELRALLNDQITGVDKLADPCFAACFYQVNRRSFNGLWRLNKQGLFNVPEGRNSKKEPIVAPFPDVNPYAELMQRWLFKCCDWQHQLAIEWNGKPANQEPRFIVCDPPYDDGFVAYTDVSFSWWRQAQLAEWAAASPHPVILLNKATDRIVALYEKMNFTVEVVSARRSISCNGDRQRVDEVIAHRNCEK